MTTESGSNVVVDGLKNIKSTVETFAKENNLSSLKNDVKASVKKAQKEFSGLVNKDIAEVKKRFAKEKAQLEKVVSATLNKEMIKAKKFLASHKKELTSLQTKVEKLVKAQKTKVTKKVAPLKKATKKVATKKVATKKTTTKKVASK